MLLNTNYRIYYMWIMTNKSFLSVVANRDDKHTLLVRARLEGHIEAAFPTADVFTNEGSDYLFRAFIPRAEVAQVIAKQIEAINYDNFKNSVKNRPYHDALLKVWTVMYTLQDKYNPFKGKSNKGLYDAKHSDTAI